MLHVMPAALLAPWWYRETDNPAWGRYYGALLGMFIFGVLLALLWAVPFCYFNGYPDEFDAANFSTTLGIPTWLFWGIAVPWLAADVFTTWFCFCYMKDDDIGEAQEGADIQEEVAEMHAHDADGGEGAGR